LDEHHERLVLMVEDDLLLADIYEKRFVAESIQIAHARSAEEALEQLERGPKPDLVLLDLHLAGMSGFEFLEKIRNDPPTAKLPVIVLSNFSDPEDLEKTKEYGVLRHIQKVSLTPAELVETVREELQALS
jgi:CheY-like chemotaxis protein